MKIVVVGGSGLIGAKVVQKLTRQGHQVVAASPSKGVNSVTGEGLEAVFAGAEVVVDVSNSPSFEDAPVLEFFETSTRNIVAAAKKAGVNHIAVLSVVGTERMLNAGYFRGKIAQERLIEASGLPYTILRATQFFEFIGAIAGAATQGDTVRLSAALIQPIAGEDVADAVAEIALARPADGILEIGGPDVLPMHQLAALQLVADMDARRIEIDPEPRYFGNPIAPDALIAGAGARLSRTSFQSWLAQR